MTEPNFITVYDTLCETKHGIGQEDDIGIYKGVCSRCGRKGVVLAENPLSLAVCKPCIDDAFTKIAQEYPKDHNGIPEHIYVFGDLHAGNRVVFMYKYRPISGDVPLVSLTTAIHAWLRQTKPYIRAQEVIVAFHEMESGTPRAVLHI